MEEKKNDILNYVDKLIEKERFIEYKESRGTIIMRNGFVFQVPQMFNFFRDNWLFFKKAILENDNEILKEINNGIVTNGIFSINLIDVSAMIAENKEGIFDFMPDEHMEDKDLEIEDEGDSQSFFGFN